MSKQIKKIIPYFLILIILVGLFSPMAKVNAQIAPPNIPGQTGITTQTAAVAAEKPVKIKLGDESGKGIENNLNECSFVPPKLNGCYEWLISKIFYEIPGFLLGIAGSFFNVIVSLTLGSELYSKATFINNAWGVVRDFSNLFFILILLYVAIQTILGMGHETKKVIVHVIIMALLINFSMFFTKIVIDSSNMLALIFYNKITVVTNYVPVVSAAKTGVQEKDVSGGMMKYFNPTRMLDKEFFDKFRKTTTSFSWKGAALATGSVAVVGSWIPIIGTGIGATAGIVGYFISSSDNTIPTGIIVGFLLIAGFIMAFATYAFFIAGLSFLARMIELWILIIFAPFAFMSWTIPKLAGREYIGWDSWTKRLIEVAFMAPIFMFFLYLIYMIIESNIFINLVDRTEAQQGWMETIILMVIPALVILILLLKATNFAKKASGELGEMVIKGAKLASGLVAGGGIGLAASGLQGGLGHLGKNMYGSKKMADWETDKGKGLVGMAKRFTGSRVRTLAGGDDGKGGMAGASFDARKGAVGGVLKLASSATGLNLGAQSKFLMKEEGGYVADLKRRDAKRKERAEGLKESASTGVKEKLREEKDNHQTLMSVSSEPIKEIEARIKKEQENKKDAKPGDKDAISDIIKKLKDQKKAIKNATATSIEDAEKEVKKAEENAKQAAEALEKNPNNQTTQEAYWDAKQKLAIAKAAKASAESAKALGLKPEDVRSINDYEDKIIKEAEKNVHHIEEETIRNFAENLYDKNSWTNKNKVVRFFIRADERKRSAQDIRMSVKPEKSQDKGHGTEHFFGDLAAGIIVNAASDHGHENKDGGGGNPPAPSGGQTPTH